MQSVFVEENQSIEEENVKVDKVQYQTNGKADLFGRHYTKFSLSISVVIQLVYCLRVTNLQATYLILQFTDGNYAGFVGDRNPLLVIARSGAGI